MRNDTSEVHDFTTLEVWQAAHKLMLDVYEFCKFLPKSEYYGRSNQLKRSSSSIPANIAEGYGRFYYLENVQFCRRARGSLYETKNHIIAARDLKEVVEEECNKLLDDCDRVKQLLNGYIRYLLKSKVGFNEFVSNHESITPNA